MGMPEIFLNFKRKATTAKKRSERGIVALIIKDTVQGIKVYKEIEDIKEKYNEDNMQYINMVLNGAFKVIVCSITQEQTIDDAFMMLKSKKWNYVTYPLATKEDNAKIISFIKTQRKNKRVCKTVLANEKADDKYIINFTTDKIKIKNSEKIYSTAEYCCRIAGVLAGLRLDRSATYFVLDEVENVEEKENANECIDNGELILINDGEKCKIARAVNSLTTIKENDTKDCKKIKIVEGMDLMREDITAVFDDEYVGKVDNIYDNKMLYFSFVNSYLQDLAKDFVLDKHAENEVGLDLEEQTKYLKEIGVNVEELEEQKIKEYNTGSKVFALAHVKFTDAMEDLYFNIFM